MARWGALGKMIPEAIEPADVARWISSLGDLQATSVRRYVTTLRQVLDHAGADPNPARDERVKLPREVRVEVEPPTGAQVEAILANVRERWRLPLQLLEATGMRVGELCALTWGDVDWPADRVRVRGGKTAARGAGCRCPRASWPRSRWSPPRTTARPRG